MQEYRVLLVEQSHIMMERLSSVVRNTKDFKLVGRYQDPREALGQGGVFMPNLILLDIDTMENINFVREFARAFPKAGIICLSGQWESAVANTSVKAGARGYLIKPFTREELTAAMETFGRNGLVTVSEVMTFFSAKGKSGKTTLIANLAMSLAKKSQQNVAIIDADLQFGDMSVFFNLAPKSTIVEAVRDINFLSPLTLNSYFMPIGDNVGVLCGTKRPELAENVGPKAFTDMVNMAKSLFRYILIDVPSGFNPISIAAAEASDAVYLVSMMQGGGFEIKHMQQALEIFKAWPDYEQKVRTVFTRVDPCTQEEETRLEKCMGYPVYGTVPNEYLLVSTAANNGRMALDIKPESPLARSVERIALKICGKQHKVV